MPSLKLWSVAAVAVPAAFFSASAFADDTTTQTDKEKQLEKRVEELEKQLNQVNQKLAASGTNAAGDTLEYHQAMRDEGWGRVKPTFRPDMAVTLSHPGWRAEIDRIGEATGESMESYGSFIRALEARRAFFKAMGVENKLLTVCGVEATTHTLGHFAAFPIEPRAGMPRLGAPDTWNKKVKDIFEDTRAIAEPSGAVSLAGLKAYAAREAKRTGALIAINSGANMNFDRLRHIAERAEIGEHREALLAVTIPERPGAYRAFIELLGRRA